MNKQEIAEQSRQWLMEALIKLMDEKSFKDITVVEISLKADLARRTFYRNFKTKEEVLEEYCNKLCNEYICFIGRFAGGSDTDLSIETVVLIFFSFWEKHLDFLRVLSKNSLMYYILEKFNAWLPQLYQIYKGDRHEYENDIERTVALLFSAGGFWNVLVGWLNSNQAVSPGEMAGIILKAVKTFANS